MRVPRVFAGLWYFRQMHIAVALGCAVATAVLAGALLVGDSMRGSLRELAVGRLGKIDFALMAPRPFRLQLATGLEADPEFQANYDRAVPALIFTGSAVNAGTGARASNVQIVGISDDFFSLFPGGGGFPDASSGFPPVLVSASLQSELALQAGNALLVSFQEPELVNREMILGRRETEDVVETMRVQVHGMLPDERGGSFSLRKQQTSARNVFVPLEVLQRRAETRGKVNTILVSPKTEADIGTLNRLLSRHFTLEEAVLDASQTDEALIVASDEIFLSAQMEQAILKTAGLLQWKTQPVLTYLANKTESDGGLLPYSTVAAIDTTTAGLYLIDGSAAPSLTGNEILLNEWAVEDLRAEPGAKLRIEYFVMGPDQRLATETSEFTVRGIVAMKGLGADSRLAPEYPGIHDADHISEWSPPFPVDLNLIRPRDEEYWDLYRATPKAFVSYETGRRLWSSRFGDLTSIRVYSESNDTPISADLFRTRLLQNIHPAAFGYRWDAVKQQALDASSGSTDFGLLFIGFSLFLILSAALLVALLFRFGAEQRAHEIGMLLATGYTRQRIIRRFLLEGAIVSAIGALLGIAGGIYYARWLISAIRAWWSESLGSSFLTLHIAPLTLPLAYLAALLITFVSLWLAIRKLVRVPPTVLLGSGTTVFEAAKPSRMQYAVSVLFLAGAAVFFGIAVWGKQEAEAVLFFATGACLLAAVLTFVSAWLRSARTQHGFRYPTLPNLAARAPAQNPGRSIISVALLACASFVIVTVAANRVSLESDPTDKSSGTGGFPLIAETDIPVYSDLNSREGREGAGLLPDSALDNVRFVNLRVRPGDDISCLNLYQPQNPKILGLPPALVETGAFSFQSTIEQTANPWTLLDRDFGDDVVPAIGDYNSLQWILKKGVGDDFVIQDQNGRSIKLRIVAALKRSIFQSELLISENNFIKHFPAYGGFSYFLIDVPLAKRHDVSSALEIELADFGFDAVNSEDKLAAYHAVENLYLSTFQILGGLGLLLGTIGLAVILLRNVVERKSELATLRAFGFPVRRLGTLVLLETWLLLIAGILGGTATALLAVTPHLQANWTGFPWLYVGGTMLLVFVTGTLACVAAVSFALRIPLMPALRAE